MIFDRLINEDDQALVQKHLVALLEVHYSEKMEYIMRDPILYGDYVNTLDPSEPRLYECIEDLPTAHVSGSRSGSSSSSSSSRCRFRCRFSNSSNSSSTTTTTNAILGSSYYHYYFYYY